METDTETEDKKATRAFRTIAEVSEELNEFICEIAFSAARDHHFFCGSFRVVQQQDGIGIKFIIG